MSAVAKRLGVSMATVHAAINSGELRWVLFGSVRRVRADDLDAYVQALVASRGPPDEDWCTAADLMRALEVSRSHAYRLLERGAVAFRVFGGVRYIRREDLATLARCRKCSSPADAPHLHHIRGCARVPGHHSS